MAVSKERLKAALTKHAGICAAAARDLGIDRSAISHRVKKDPELKAFIEEIMEGVDDLTQGIIVSTLSDRTMMGKPTHAAQQMAKWWREYRLRTQMTQIRIKAAAAGAGGDTPAGLKIEVTVEYVTATPEPEDEEVPV